MGVLKELSLDDRLRMQAESREKLRRDMEMMKMDGWSEGIAEGEARGRAITIRETASRAIEAGAEDSFVAFISGMSVPEVEALRRSLVNEKLE